MYVKGNLGHGRCLACIDTDPRPRILEIVDSVNLAFDDLLTAELSAPSKVLERPFRIRGDIP